MTTTNVKERIFELRNSGKTIRETAEQLNAEGLTTSTGLAFNMSSVSNLIYGVRRPKRTRVTAATPKGRKYPKPQSIIASWIASAKSLDSNAKVAALAELIAN